MLVTFMFASGAILWGEIRGLKSYEWFLLEFVSVLKRYHRQIHHLWMEKEEDSVVNVLAMPGRRYHRFWWGPFHWTEGTLGSSWGPSRNFSTNRRVSLDISSGNTAYDARFQMFYCTSKETKRQLTSASIASYPSTSKCFKIAGRNCKIL